jgi:phosphate transport system protein
MADEQRLEFHEHLEEIRQGIAALSAQVAELCSRATDILLEGDLEGAAYLIEADDEIDRRCRELEELCFTQIALQQPVASDLRELVAGIKILADVERSADLCANICKAARRIFSHDLGPQLRGSIQRMGDQGQLLFRQATEAYLHNSEVMAAAVKDIDAYMDGLHRELFRTIFEAHRDGTIDLQVGVQLGLVARFYERIGDHAVNVGEHTRYIVNGWFPTHPYPESGNPVPTATSEPPDDT